MRRFYEEVARADAQAALATVIRAEGSTYRKEGAMLLIRPDGTTVGIISGGCLEADLAERVRHRLPLHQPELIAYDARETELWGLPLGCGGRLELLVEPVNGLHRQMAAAWLAGRPFTLVIDPALGTVASGTGFVQKVLPPPILWVVGAGPEAEPLVAGALAAGWRVRLVEARLADPARFPGAEVVVRWGPEELARRVGPDDYAVVMHHHLELDRAYLQALLRAPLRYLGALGPLHRTAALLGDSPAPAHLYAPVGLDLGGEGPEAIALSILAEVQAVRHGRAGGHLRAVKGEWSCTSRCV
jgi:xanthine dehydrogenase accessory factor